MKLPTWAKPLDGKHTRYCDCEYKFVAIGKAQLEGFGSKWWYSLCPVCMVYEKEIKQTITYRQAERWTARLIPLLTLQRDTVRAEQKAKAAAAKQAKKKAAAEKEAARLKALHARKRGVAA